MKRVINLKQNLVFATLLGAIAVMSFAVNTSRAGEEGSWFDLENCGMCKHMVAEEGLMDNMGWEHHLTKSGMMSVTTVTPEYTEAFGRCMIKMEEASAKLMGGEKMELCGFCESSMGLMSGEKVAYENFETIGGYVCLMTSNDAEMVKKIHAHGQRTIDEYAKIMAAEKAAATGHEGHSHD